MRIYEGLDEDGGPVDCSVGSIVWVRRRNGSWWPGRILGPEELSASHLMSPRSGTPVKLLGREDASVDWYNLEKSKRVKAFRCGEFDACIERVEASNSISIKKREKYARREDAILHALELEKQQEFGNFSVSISTKMSGSSKNELINFSSEVYMSDDEPRVHSKFASHKSRAVAKKSAARHGEDNIHNSFCSRKVRYGKQLFWEEDIPESLPRMRGLQDFGLRIAPKKKFFPSVAWEASCKPVGNHVDVLSSGMVGAAVHAGCSRKSLFIKRKRTQGGTVEDSLVKKRDRRRPLVQVLQSSAKLPVFHSVETDQDAGVSSIQGKEDDTDAVRRAKRSRCIYLSADPNDSLDHSGCYSEEITTTTTQFEMDDLRHQPSLAEECTSSGLSETTESDSTERDFWAAGIEDEMDLLTDDARAVPRLRDYHLSEFQDSNKLRDITSSSMMRSSYSPQLHLDEQCADVGVSKWHMKGKRNARTLPKRPYMNRKLPLRTEASSRRVRGCYRNSDGSDSGSTDYGNRRYSIPIQAAKSREDSDDDSQLIARSGWEDLFYSDNASILVEVDLKVQASYQGEHVPLVSLMSRLNGKAIVGHPIQIEILEGSFVGLDGSTTGRPPVWRTARRTAMQRLPRCNPSPSALGGEDAADPPYSDREILGKNVWKRASLSSQKTRTLSSIATEQKAKSKNRGVGLGGLITPDGAVSLVTRVPLKVVFSRILEAIGRPSGTQRVRQ